MGLRWGVSLKKTELLSHFELLFRNALACLPENVYNKQARFHFRDDSLATVVGQLLIRKAIVEELHCEWDDFDLAYGSKGKPMLASSFSQNLDFNISHQGDLVVLATSRDSQIGVDVMRIDEDRNNSALEHIDKMSKLFTDSELNTMRLQETELDRWRSFYRVWCLKEAVLKATGIGLVNDLRSFAFHTDRKDKHVPGCQITSTIFSEKDIIQPNWLFEESYIESEHGVAVGRLFNDTKNYALAKESIESKFPVFKMKSLDELLEKSRRLNSVDDDDVAEEFGRYIQKPWKEKY